jgi:tRNA-specific adenosine deaminase 1
MSCTSFPEKIAKCALDHYHKKLNKGKPKDETEWTVYAAIVASLGGDDDVNSRWVVSCATGTKCTTLRKEGCIVHDCHAEVLSRRGLMRVLQLEMIQSKQRKDAARSEDSSHKAPNSFSQHLLETTTDDTTKFQLRKDLQLHLYISDSPCGDGSIYSVDDKQDNDGVQYTGAKVIVSQDTRVDSTDCGGHHQLLDGTNVAREEVQLLGKLRTKSGRSNLPAHLRSTSMSCSDKIVQWSILGLQGGLLSDCIVDPIRLTSVVVSRDPRVTTPQSGTLDAQLVALERAIPMRVQAVWDYLDNNDDDDDDDCGMLIPIVHVAVVSQVFDSGKAVTAARSNKRQIDTEPFHNNKPTATTVQDKASAPNEQSEKKRKRNQGPTISPCGFALNWQQSEPTQTEILVGARGIRQGKKPKSIEDYQKLASRLSRTELLRAQQQLVVSFEDKKHAKTYQEFKSHIGGSHKKWRNLKLNIFKGGPLVGWLVDKEDFSIPDA